MKIIFLVYRTNNYRYYAPLIEEGLRRGYRVECWHDYGQPQKGSKAYTFPARDLAPHFETDSHPQIRTFRSDEELNTMLLKDTDIDAVFSIQVFPARLKEAGMKGNFHWGFLLTGPDNFAHFPRRAPLDSPWWAKAIFFIYSDIWKKTGYEYVKSLSPEYAGLLAERGGLQYETVGSPEFDFFSKVIHPDEVRRKYNIPEGKDVLLYLPFGYGNREKSSAWEKAFCGILLNTKVSSDGELIHDERQSPLKNFIHRARCLSGILRDPFACAYWRRGVNEEKVFKALRRFADKYGLYLIVKPRMKYPIPQTVSHGADLVVWDDDRRQIPPILKELLSVTRLTFSFFSYSVLTSVFAGVYHLAGILPGQFFNKEINQKFWYSSDSGSIFHFPGACEAWHLEDIIDRLENTPIERFAVDESKRNSYIARYIGFDDHSSSKRVLDVLERERIETANKWRKDEI